MIDEIPEYPTPWEARILRGRRVSFTVTRDSQRVQREGTITGVTPTILWVGCYCYHRSELAGLYLYPEAM